MRRHFCGILTDNCVSALVRPLQHCSSHWSRHLRLQIWFNGCLGAAHLTASILEEGPVFIGSDYRLLVSIRDPFRWVVSAYLFYGLRGQEFGTRNDMGETHDARAMVKLVLGNERFEKLPKWPEEMFYSDFIRSLSVPDGLLIEMSRQIGYGQLAAGYPKYTTAQEFEDGFNIIDPVNNQTTGYKVRCQIGALPLVAAAYPEKSIFRSPTGRISL